MDMVLMIVLSAFLSWVVEKSADGVLAWVIEKLKSDRKANHHSEPSKPSENSRE